MPWRTLIEVAKYLNEKDVNAEIISISVRNNEVVPYSYKEVRINIAERPLKELCRYLENGGYDVLVYPTPWREALKDFSEFNKLPIRKIAYLPGGVYNLGNLISLLRNAGLNITLPYLLDYLVPARWLISKLNRAQFASFVGLTPTSAIRAKEARFANSICILPGKDDFENLKDDIEVFDRLHITKEKFFLFIGAPAVIRGASLLLKAIDSYANQNGDIFCVFLMRTDVGSSFNDFIEKYDKLKNKNHIQIIKVNLTRNELKTIVCKARGVILPFLIIPSEIPLTFLEVLSTGTPIVTFKNGGTTEYLKNVVLSSRSGKINGLIRNMDKLWKDDATFSKLKNVSSEFMREHPDWSQVGSQWYKLIKDGRI